MTTSNSVPRHLAGHQPQPTWKRYVNLSNVIAGAAITAATGAAAVGLFGMDHAPTASQNALTTVVTRQVAATGEAAAVDRSRVITASRSADRTPVAVAKARAIDESSGGSIARTAEIEVSDPRSFARAMLATYGWGQDQFGCLDSLYMRESGWNHLARNPSSGAYGIPQSLPATKMASAGADYLTNPETQIRWGLGYIRDRYGSPCGAWGHSQSVGWY